MTNEFHLELFPGAANSGHPCTCDIGENHPPSAKVAELRKAQRELAGLARRMAEDEANEGNYEAAASLTAAADTAPDYDAPMNRGPLDPDTKAAVAKALEESRELYLETVGIAAEDTEAGGTGDVHPQLIQMSEVPGHTTSVQEELGNALARIKELEANERSRQFVAKSLDRLKPQLTRRIADVICPPLNVSAEEVKGWKKDVAAERTAAWLRSRAEAVEAAERLVEAGLRFVPTDAETELAAKHLRFIVACTDDQSFLQEWDGELFELPDQAADDLATCRKRINRAGTRAPEAANWAVFGLVRVPDEIVFPEADRG